MVRSAITMLKKRFHNHYYNQTNPKPQLKPKKQTEKTLTHTKQTNNNQFENPKKQPPKRIN
jgi:hypothetical protein